MIRLNFFLNLKTQTKSENVNDYYNVLRRISKGKFSSIFTAKNKLTNEKVAIKVINKLKDNRPSSIQKTQMDIFNFLKINKHENLINIYDIFEDMENIFIVMEFFTKTSLSEYLTASKSKMKIENIKLISNQISQSLLFLQKVGIVHRDLKPENILITKNLKIKISGFGFSRFLHPNQLIKERLDNFDFSFSAPELILNKHYNFKIDIWSFGIIMHTLVAAVFPFDLSNINRPQVGYQNLIINDYQPEINNCPHGKLKVLIFRCLLKRSSKRIDIHNVIKSNVLY